MATTTVPWYCDADGVAMPARLQTSQIVSSGPTSRPHLMQLRGSRLVGRCRHRRFASGSRSPAAIGTVSQFSWGASGQDQIGSYTHDG